MRYCMQCSCEREFLRYLIPGPPEWWIRFPREWDFHFRCPKTRSSLPHSPRHLAPIRSALMLVLWPFSLECLWSVSVLRPLLRFSSSVPCFSLFCHHSQSSEKQCTVASKTAGEHWARDDHIFFLDKHFAHKTIEHQHHFVLVVNRRQHIESRQQGIYRDTKTIKESVSPFWKGQPTLQASCIFP